MSLLDLIAGRITPEQLPVRRVVPSGLSPKPVATATLATVVTQRGPAMTDGVRPVAGVAAVAVATAPTAVLMSESSGVAPAAIATAAIGELTTEPAADVARGRRLLDRLRWTGRYIGLVPDGTLVVRPRLGTADPFGGEVAAHPDDIAAALVAEVRENATGDPQ